MLALHSDMFNEATETCSYTTEFISKNWKTARTLGQTEAEFNEVVISGHLGVLEGKHYDTGLSVGTVLLRGKNLLHNRDVRAYWSGSSFEIQMMNAERKWVAYGSKKEFDEFSDFVMDSSDSIISWRVPTMKPNPVAAGSKSVGAMTDEEMATMFVKTKDEFAKAKGVNIKGANPLLDNEVFEAIAKQAGYTAAEAKAKVEAYKASGHKLSALKKKTMKAEATVKSPTATVGSTPVAKVVKKPADDAIHLSPSSPAVKAAVDDLQKTAVLYKDEDVVKAYVKAKDAVAADPLNKYTLYSKGPDFDFDIAMKMYEQSKIDLSPLETQKHIANYLASGKKISVLKKQMIKSGEMKPAAETLKMSKAEKLLNTPKTKSASEATKLVDDFASSGATPVGAAPYELSVAQEQAVFNDLSMQMYKNMSPADAFMKMDVVAQQHGLSTLNVARAYDKLKAKQLGITNGNLYEKKVAEWLAGDPNAISQVAQIRAKAAQQAAAKKVAEQAKLDAAAKAKAKKEADEKLLEEFRKNVLPLPADSANFPVISTQEALEHHMKRRPWSSEEKSALQTYTGSAYTPMNGLLRGETHYATRHYADLVNNAQAGMRVVEEDFLVHRGAGYNSLSVGSHQSSFSVDDHAKWFELQGKTVKEDGFFSTSVAGRAAFDSKPVIFEIEVPKGTSGAYLKPISGISHENEFLMAAGQEYKILSVSIDDTPYGKKTVVRMRAIPGTHRTELVKVNAPPKNWY